MNIFSGIVSQPNRLRPSQSTTVSAASHHNDAPSGHQQKSLKSPHQVSQKTVAAKSAPRRGVPPPLASAQPEDKDGDEGEEEEEEEEEEERSGSGEEDEEEGEGEEGEDEEEEGEEGEGEEDEDEDEDEDEGDESLLVPPTTNSDKVREVPGQKKMKKRKLGQVEPYVSQHRLVRTSLHCI